MPWTQTGDYRQIVLNAMASWHASPTAVRTGYGYETTLAYSKMDFRTEDRPYDDWVGLTVLHPCQQSGCWYSYADIYLNSNANQLGNPGVTDFRRQKTAAHEFGHGLGLAHPDCWFCNFNSIMFQGELAYNTPQQHDIDDTNAIYPRP